MKYTFILSTIIILVICQRGDAQPVGLGNMGSDAIGITVWSSSVWQIHSPNSDPKCIAPNRVGINIKYGSWGMIKTDDKLSYLDTAIIDYIRSGDTLTARKYKIAKKERTPYFMRVSYGIGYQTLMSMSSSAQTVSSTFNLSGPYSGFYFSIPLSSTIGQSRKPWKDTVDNYRDNITFVLAYNAGIVGATDLNADFKSIRTTGPVSDSPIVMNLASTVMHDLDIGFGFHVGDKSWWFIEGGYSYLKFTNVAFKSIDETKKLASFIDELPKSMDLSSWVLKIGYSGNF